jgi:propanol-preferring alcohol dehydrogenase
MAKKMEAAFVEYFGKPLVVMEVDIPKPGPGQILVKTEACGVCHTDLHAARGDWPLKPALPFIPGHEGIGLVVAMGADPNYVAHVPKGLSAQNAAPLICAGITTYKGIKEANVKAGEWIAISGAGGLGHLAIQYAMGLQICAIDIDDGKLALAKSLGADLVINAKHGDPAAALKKETGGGAHGVLITAPSLSAFKQGIEMTRKCGTCVLVGLPPGDFPVPLFGVVADCITIRGSFVGNREDMAEALSFAVDGRVKADIEMQPLSAINQVFGRLQHGKVAGRVVLDFVGAENKSDESKTASQKPMEVVAAL